MPRPARAAARSASPLLASRLPPTRTVISSSPRLKLQPSGCAAVAVAQAIVAGEIGGLGRGAGAGEVGRRGGADEAGGGEAPRDQAAVGQPADADGQVEALLEQVDDPVVEAELDLDRRVGGEELRQQRAQMEERRTSWAR